MMVRALLLLLLLEAVASVHAAPVPVSDSGGNVVPGDQVKEVAVHVLPALPHLQHETKPTTRRTLHEAHADDEEPESLRSDQFLLEKPQQLDGDKSSSSAEKTPPKSARAVAAVLSNDTIHMLHSLVLRGTSPDAQEKGRRERLQRRAPPVKLVAAAWAEVAHMEAAPEVRREEKKKQKSLTMWGLLGLCAACAAGLLSAVAWGMAKGGKKKKKPLATAVTHPTETTVTASHASAAAAPATDPQQAPPAGAASGMRPGQGLPPSLLGCSGSSPTDGRGRQGRSSSSSTSGGVGRGRSGGSTRDGEGRGRGRSGGNTRGRGRRGRSTGRRSRGGERPQRSGGDAATHVAGNSLASGAAKSDGHFLGSVGLDHLPRFQLAWDASGRVVVKALRRSRSSRRSPLPHLTALSRAIELLGGKEKLAIVRFKKRSELSPINVQQVIINSKPYSFLCATDEQQSKREPEALFFKGNAEEAERALALLGDYSVCKTAAKMSRRLRLTFWHGAFLLPPLGKEDLVDISDIERGRYCFTDGCGFMHPRLAKDLARHLQLTYVPSCFQIRIAGYKGVVLVYDSKHSLLPSRPWKLQLRNSMHKFDWEDYQLGIVKYSKPATIGWLNNSLILLLHARRIPITALKEVVQESIKEELQKVQYLPSESALTMLYEEYFDFVMQTFKADDPQRISPTALDVLRSVQEKRSKKAHTKLGDRKISLPVAKSRFLLGVADPTGTLEQGHCYVRLTSASGGNPWIVTLKVLVTRSPAYNLGDLRVLQAAASPRLDGEKYLNDVIVFPTKGDRPHPDEMGGGDLDGDEYFVCWDDRLLPPDQKYPAADFSNGACAFQVRPLVTPLGLSRHDRLRHFLNTVNCPNPPVTLGEIDSCFQYWAEEKDPASSECRRLAAIFNCAVDGKEVVIPDFLRPADLGHRRRHSVVDKLLDVVLHQMSSDNGDGTADHERPASFALRDEDVRAWLEETVLTGPALRFLVRWCSYNDQDPEEYMAQHVHGVSLSDRDLEWVKKEPFRRHCILVNALHQSAIIKQFGSEMLLNRILGCSFRACRHPPKDTLAATAWEAMVKRAINRGCHLAVVVKAEFGVCVLAIKILLSEEQALRKGATPEAGFSGDFPVKELQLFVFHRSPSMTLFTGATDGRQEYNLRLDQASQRLQLFRGRENNTFVNISKSKGARRPISISIDLRGKELKRQVPQNLSDILINKNVVNDWEVYYVSHTGQTPGFILGEKFSLELQLSATSAPLVAPPEGFSWPKPQAIAIVPVEDGEEDRYDNGSFRRQTEVEAIEGIVKDVLKADNKTSICLITAFSAQQEALEESAAQFAGSLVKVSDGRLPEPVVDTDMCDLVILSCVRRCEGAQVYMPPQLLSCCRCLARRGLIVVGHKQTLMNLDYDTDLAVLANISDYWTDDFC